MKKTVSIEHRYWLDDDLEVVQVPVCFSSGYLYCSRSKRDRSVPIQCLQKHYSRFDYNKKLNTLVLSN